MGTVFCNLFADLGRPLPAIYPLRLAETSAICHIASAEWAIPGCAGETATGTQKTAAWQLRGGYPKPCYDDQKGYPGLTNASLWT